MSLLIFCHIVFAQYLEWYRDNSNGSHLDSRTLSVTPIIFISKSPPPPPSVIEAFVAGNYSKNDQPHCTQSLKMNKRQQAWKTFFV